MLGDVRGVKQAGEERLRPKLLWKVAMRFHFIHLPFWLESKPALS
jgi:hypothetical protein